MLLGQLIIAVALAANAAPTEAPAAATAQARPIKLAAPGLKAVNISEGDAAFYSDHLAQQLKVIGLQVSAASDISALLGLERQKQLLGCGEESASCVTELAGALGADGLLTGSLGKFGPVYQINLNILSATDGTQLAVFSSRVSGEEPLLDEFTKAARQMARELHLKMGRPIPDSLIEQSPLRRYFWIPIAAGAVSAGAGGFLFAQSRDHYKALTEFNTAKVTPDSVTYAQAGATQQTAGVALLTLGVAAVAGGAVMYLLGAPAMPVSGGVQVAEGSAKVTIGGSFP